MPGFTEDLKAAQAARGQADSSVVAPVAPADLNRKQGDLNDPAGKPLSQQDLKVTKPAAPAAPAQPEIADIRAQMSAQDSLIVDMSSLMSPIGAEAPNVAAAAPAGGSAQSADSPPTQPSAESSHSSPLEGTPPPAAEAPASASTSAPTFKLGTKEFKTAEELLAYAQGLENRGGQIDLTQLLDPNKLAPPEPQDPDPADILFEDPKRAVELIKKQAKAEVQAELRQRDTQATLEKARTDRWAEFYRANADLVGFEDIVQSQINLLPPTSNLEEGLATAAKKSRVRVAEIRQKLVPTEVVSTRVVSAPANPVEPPAPPAPPAPKVTSMVDEMAEMRRQKRGA